MPSVVQRHFLFSSQRNVNLSLENLTNLFEDSNMTISKEITFSSNKSAKEAKIIDNLNGSVENTEVKKNPNETSKETKVENKIETESMKENKSESDEETKFEENKESVE